MGIQSEVRRLSGGKLAVLLVRCCQHKIELTITSRACQTIGHMMMRAMGEIVSRFAGPRAEMLAARRLADRRQRWLGVAV